MISKTSSEQRGEKVKLRLKPIGSTDDRHHRRIVRDRIGDGTHGRQTRRQSGPGGPQ